VFEVIGHRVRNDERMAGLSTASAERKPAAERGHHTDEREPPG
jgi:hypothetical protein